MDRLLSEQEICKLCVNKGDCLDRKNPEVVCSWSKVGEANRLLAAQDAKTAAAVNAEFGEWIEKFFKENDVVFMGNTLPAITSSAWQERKRSIGL